MQWHCLRMIGSFIIAGRRLIVGHPEWSVVLFEMVPVNYEYRTMDADWTCWNMSTEQFANWEIRPKIFLVAERDDSQSGEGWGREVIITVISKRENVQWNWSSSFDFSEWRHVNGRFDWGFISRWCHLSETGHLHRVHSNGQMLLWIRPRSIMRSRGSVPCIALQIGVEDRSSVIGLEQEKWSLKIAQKEILP